MSSNTSFHELQQAYYIRKECSYPSLGKPGIVSNKILKFRPKCTHHLVAFYQRNLIMVLQQHCQSFLYFFCFPTYYKFQHYPTYHKFQHYLI